MSETLTQTRVLLGRFSLLLVLGCSIYCLVYYLTQEYFSIKITRKDGNVKDIRSQNNEHESEFLRKNCFKHKGNRMNLNSDMIRRVNHLCNACSTLTHIQGTMEHKKFKSLTKNGVMYFPKFDIAYCQVPKAGQTFLSRMFETLDSESVNATAQFGMARSTVHRRSIKGHSASITDEFPTIVVARDPFTRLYSAYIDKIFLPTYLDLSIKIKCRLKSHAKCSKMLTSPKCGGPVSFESFLQHVIYSSKKSSNLDSDWTPISAMCQPCRLNTYMIIKHESYSEDIEAFLTSSNVPISTQRKIKNPMTTNRIESTLPGIIESIVKRYRNQKRVHQCLNDIDFLNLLWQSFQIQGYISRIFTFSEKYFKTFTISYDRPMIKNVFLNAVRTSNMSKSESLEQRRHYLVKAYTTVSTETLMAIVKLFKADFLLFDYDMKPPR